MISAIAAIGKDTRVVGKDNDLVWDIPADLERFRTITRGHPVIMGRKTWESIPAERRPLPKRTNIVVTRNLSYEAPGASIVSSVEDAIAQARKAPGGDQVYVIGGGQIYEAALPYTDELILTLVDDNTPGDVHFPDYGAFSNVVFEEKHSEHLPSFEYITLRRQ